VSVHSDGPGQGALFTVVLPLESEAAPRSVSGRDATDIGAARRVLIIGDNSEK
jgi:hypothetical protein